MAKEFIIFRVTEDEYNIVQEKARKANLKVSPFAKKAVFDKEIVVVDGLKEFTKELSKIGRNINQLTVLCHQGKITCADLTAVNRLMIEIWQLLSMISKPKKTKDDG